MIPDDVPASAAELRPTAGALAWRDAAFQHAEQPMAVPIASLTFTEEGDVTVTSRGPAPPRRRAPGFRSSK